MYIQVDGLQKEVSGDRKLRLHTARITSGIMNAVGSMHRHGHSHTAGRTLSIIYRPTMSTRNYNFPLVSYFLFVTRLPHIASPARTVPKYCDECVCLSVCLSDRISPEPHAQFGNFLCMLPMSMARSSSGMFTIGRIAYRREGVFFTIDSTL